MSNVVARDRGGLGPGGPAEIDERAGDTYRQVDARWIDGYCATCERAFTDTAAAAAHARNRRHRVRVHYVAVFSFVPRELPGGEEW